MRPFDRQSIPSIPSIVSAVLLALSACAHAQEVNLKFHHIWPTTAMPAQKLITPWCDKIAAESNNRMKCQLLPAMSGGGTPPQLIDRVKDGVDDIVITLPGYTPGRFPSLEAFELPFMTNNAEGAAKAVWEYHQKYSAKEFAGVKILATWVHDEGFIHNAKQSIKTLEDLKGLKIRSPHRQGLKMLNTLGATGVAMPPTAVADAISKGTLDGVMFPWEAITGFRVTEVVKYHTETHPSRPSMYTAVFVMAMNQAKFDSLPADLKAILEKNGGLNGSGAAGKLWDDSVPPSRKVAVDRKNEITQLSQAETDRWIKAVGASYDDWTADMDKRGLNGKAMLQDARDLLKKHTK
jgi:TRAP-type C4-dicarboxylate transport system substrate-binding protein